MRKLIATMSLLAVAAVPAVGCGADDVDPTAVADAAQTTPKADTARVDVRFTTKGFGLPAEMTVRGNGVTALSRADLDLALDLGPIMRLVGQSGDGDARLLVRGKHVYLHPPALEGFALPEEAKWVSLDLEKTVTAIGIDAKGLGEVMTLDPGAQLDVLREADEVEEVGKEQVGDAEATHYRGTLRIRDFVEKLPADRRAAAEKALDGLERETPDADAPTSFDVWIDREDRIRRLDQIAAVPRQAGVPAGEIRITMDLSDFGAELSADVPKASETFDATDVVKSGIAAGGTTRR